MSEQSAAEQMREACAKLCETEAENHGRRANNDAYFPSDRSRYRLCAAIRRNCANEIRALPLPKPSAPAGIDPDSLVGKGMDQAADFIFRTLTKALKLKTFEPKDGTETWEGDVSATLYSILSAAGVLE
jgi:hypothetical protein